VEHDLPTLLVARRASLMRIALLFIGSVSNQNLTRWLIYLVSNTCIAFRRLDCYLMTVKSLKLGQPAQLDRD